MAIVAAVDRSERAPAIVEEAATLAEAFDESVHVVHVLTRDEFVSLERTTVDDTGRTVPVEDVIEVAEDIAADAIEEAGVDDARPVGLLGDPAEEIAGYVESNDARYLVVAGRNRSPVGKVLFGSVAQSVMLEATCPVVFLRGA